MLKNIMTLTLAATTLATAPAAMAQERNTQTVGVSYSDLDLTTENGREELDRRIDTAAKDACGMDERPTGSNMASRESRNCYREAKQQLDAHFAQLMQDQQRGG